MGILDFTAEQPYEDRQRQLDRGSLLMRLGPPAPLPFSRQEMRRRGDTRIRSNLASWNPLSAHQGEVPANENIGYSTMDAAKELGFSDEHARQAGDLMSEYILPWTPGVAAGTYGDWAQRHLRKGELGPAAWEAVQAKIGPDAMSLARGGQALLHIARHGPAWVMHAPQGLLNFIREEGDALPYRAALRLMDATSKTAMAAYPRIATNIGVFNDEMANRMPWWPFTGTSKAIAGEQEEP